MKQQVKIHGIGWALASLLVLLAGGFVWLLADSRLLAWPWMLLTGAILTLSAGVVLWLTWDCRKRIKTVIGSVLAVLLILLQLVAGHYLTMMASTLENITSPEAEYAEIGVFVRQDDGAKQLQDAENYTFGILGVLDRNATDSALKHLEELFGHEVTHTSYLGLLDLVDSLLDSREVDAILLNKGFLELLKEMENHETDLSQLRELKALQVEDTLPEEEKEPVADVTQPFTMYISGMDSYGSLSLKSRSDVNIIATVNPQTEQILLISTPRDYYVPLSISNGEPDKLTHAGFYGTQVSKETHELLYDMKIDHYFKLNFSGFEQIIDALGGITVKSDYAFYTRSYKFKKGDNQMDGKKALAFARERKAVPGGDRQRGRHQMAVIKAVVEKASGSALLKNFKGILDGVAGTFETDMPYETMAALIQLQMDKNIHWHVVTYSVNGTGATKHTYSTTSKAYVLVPDPSTVEHAKELMQQVKQGEIPTP